MGTKKNFVIDTNVILHDYNCLKNFQENDIYLPLVVLEELDKFKKGNEQINFNAREFVRELDLLTSDELFSKGVSLGEGLGRLFIVPGNVDAPKVHESFPVKKPDHLILAAVEYLAGKYPKTPAILVTKDVNLRMKARSIGITSEDYITDKVSNVDIFEKSNEIFENVDPALIDRIYSSKEGIDLSEFDFKDVIHPNECFVLKSDRNSVLARYNPFTHSICRVTKGRNYGIEPRNAEQSFAFEILNDLATPLRWIGIASSVVDKIDYAASGGVSSPEAVVKAILAGATAVEVCSAVYQNTNAFIGESTRFLSAWMERKGFESIAQFKGKLNIKDVQGINTFERTQFLKYFGKKEN